jgi:hypothetical protein
MERLRRESRAASLTIEGGGNRHQAAGDSPVPARSGYQAGVRHAQSTKYPAAHACASISVTRVLGYLFPRDAEARAALGERAAESRVWAGILPAGSPAIVF